jgi:hypothetical protein
MSIESESKSPNHPAGIDQETAKQSILRPDPTKAACFHWID